MVLWRRGAVGASMVRGRAHAQVAEIMTVMDWVVYRPNASYFEASKLVLSRGQCLCVVDVLNVVSCGVFVAHCAKATPKTTLKLR